MPDYIIMKKHFAVLMTMFIITMITSVHLAAAQSTPSVHDLTPLCIPGTVLSRCSLESDVDETIPPATGDPDLAIAQMAVYYDPDEDLSTGPNVAPCTALTPEVGDKMYVLVTGADPGPYTIVKAEHLDVEDFKSSIYADRNELSVPAVVGGGFGTGGEADEFASVNAGFTNLIGGVAKWKEKTSGGAIVDVSETTGFPGLWYWVECAWLETDDDRIFDGTAAGETPNAIYESFILTSLVVGGESMMINTTQLLVAGAQTNALWILPILGLAGTVIAIRKLEA